MLFPLRRLCCEQSRDQQLVGIRLKESTRWFDPWYTRIRNPIAVYCKTKILKLGLVGNIFMLNILNLQVLSSAAAGSAIAALSPGGVLMQPATHQAINRKCARWPKNIIDS